MPTTHGRVTLNSYKNLKYYLCLPSLPPPLPPSLFLPPSPSLPLVCDCVCVCDCLWFESLSLFDMNENKCSDVSLIGFIWFLSFYFFHFFGFIFNFCNFHSQINCVKKRTTASLCFQMKKSVRRTNFHFILCFIFPLYRFPLSIPLTYPPYRSPLSIPLISIDPLIDSPFLSLTYLYLFPFLFFFRSIFFLFFFFPFSYPFVTHCVTDDMEEYREDRAVQIGKKELKELLCDTSAVRGASHRCHFVWNDPFTGLIIQIIIVQMTSSDIMSDDVIILTIFCSQGSGVT